MKFEYSAALVWLLASPIACKDKPRPPPPDNSAHAVASGSLVTFDGFEGEITLTVNGALRGPTPLPGAMNITVLVKDGRLRVPLPDLLPITEGLGMAYLLVVPGKKELYAVSDNKKQATLIELDALLAHAKAPDPAGTLPNPSTAKAPELEKTGESDTIAGYRCERWVIELATAAIDLCVAKQPTPWLHVPLGGASAEYAWAAELTDGNHLPLRFVTLVHGAEHGRIEITSIKETSVQASNLQVPTDYGVSTLAQLLSSFGLDSARAPSAEPGFQPPPRVNPTRNGSP